MPNLLTDNSLLIDSSFKSASLFFEIDENQIRINHKNWFKIKDADTMKKRLYESFVEEICPISLIFVNWGRYRSANLIDKVIIGLNNKKNFLKGYSDIHPITASNVVHNNNHHCNIIFRFQLMCDAKKIYNLFDNKYKPIIYRHDSQFKKYLNKKFPYKFKIEWTSDGGSISEHKFSDMISWLKKNHRNNDWYFFGDGISPNVTFYSNNQSKTVAFKLSCF